MIEKRLLFFYSVFHCFPFQCYPLVVSIFPKMDHISQYKERKYRENRDKIGGTDKTEYQKKNITINKTLQK